MTITTVDRRDSAAPAQASAALAIRPGQSAWDDFQVAALAQLGLKDAADGDRAVFLHQCQRTGLDPFARQIYMIARNEKKNERRGNAWVETWTVRWTIQTGIDGWRVIRGRAEKREGVRCRLGRAVWYDGDGNDYKVWVRPDPPAACEITLTVVGAGGTETPYTSVLMFREYVQTKDGRAIAQWATKPAHMLEKCTEADVYRKAFPQDFSGIDLDDAMPPPEAAPAAAARPVARGEIVRERPARPAPAAAEQPAPPEPTPASAPADSAPPATPPREEPPARPTGSAVGRLAKLMVQVGITDPEDAAIYLEWTAGHPALEALTRDGVQAATKRITDAYEAAGKDAMQAGHLIWTAYKAEHPEDTGSTIGGDAAQTGDGGTE
jgi:phage recombination protein Bet